jgi:TP901 family phage tail tape measure protein
MTREIEARLRISAVDKTGQVFKAVSGKMGEIDKRAHALNQRQSAIARTSDAMMLSLARYAGPAVIGAGLVYATKQAANFEESLLNIQKKSSATTEQMAKMRGEIEDLAGQMPVSMDEIAKGFERGAAAGIPMEDLRDFAKLSVMVADAWDSSAEDVSNTFAGFRVGLGIPLDQMKAYASLINDLADSGISDEKDIADFIDRTGASLRNFGMSPQEIAAYGAAMLNLKMPSDVAARALNSVSSKLLAPENLSPKAHKALEAIVGDVTKFSKLAGNQKMMFFLDQLEKLTGQKRASLLGALLGEGFSDEVARLVGGLDEVRRNMQMADQQTKQASNSVDKVFESRMTLFNSQLAVLENNVNQLAIRTGNFILPAANAVVGGINDSLSEADAKNKALEGMDYAMKNRQRNQFLQRYRELNPDRGWFDGGMDAYQSALTKVGRGELQDVSDYLKNDETLRKYIDGKVRESTGGAHSMSPTDRTEFPGRDSHYDPRNLPLTGVPIPSSREAVLRKSQLDAYNEGRTGLIGADNVRKTQHDAVREQLRNMPASAVGMYDPNEVQQAGRDIGSAATDQINQDAKGIGSQIGASAASAIAEAVASAVKAIRGAASAAVGTNANTGRSMPPSANGPAGGGGGGGF